MLYFLQNPDQVLTKEAILSHCWEDPDAAGGNSLYVHIRQLRSIIEDTPAARSPDTAGTSSWIYMEID